MKVTELVEMRQKLLNHMAEVAIYLGRNPMADDFDDKVAEYEAIKDELDKLPTLNEFVKTGRPTIGVARRVAITLPEQDWKQIEETIAEGHVKSYSEYFREVHYHAQNQEV